MFEDFTDLARRAVVMAQEEARILGHDCIGAEHILLGLVRTRGGMAAQALGAEGITLRAAREQVGDISGRGQQPPAPRIPFTPEAKKLLESSVRAARDIGSGQIGTEHLLLALIAEDEGGGESVAAQVLVRLGTSGNQVRQQLIRLLHNAQAEGGDNSGEAEHLP